MVSTTSSKRRRRPYWTWLIWCLVVTVSILNGQTLHRLFESDAELLDDTSIIVPPPTSAETTTGGDDVVREAIQFLPEHPQPLPPPLGAAAAAAENVSLFVSMKDGTNSTTTVRARSDLRYDEPSARYEANIDTTTGNNDDGVPRTKIVPGEVNHTTPQPTSFAPTSSAPTKTPFRFVASSPEQQAAIDAYRNKVERSYQRRRNYCSSNNNHTHIMSIQLRHALACLHQTTPLLQLQYPAATADAHFYEIRRAMSHWAQHAQHRMHEAAGFSGPWIENQWISHFEDAYDKDGDSTNTTTTCLWDHFGPFVPIFLPWLDHWLQSPHRFRYPEGFLDTLLAVLRPDVPYITVSQNDEGLVGRRNEFDHRHCLPNLLVLSAGGFGHVPIPLLKQEEPVVVHNNITTAISDRSRFLSYTGSLSHAPKDMRQRLHEHLRMFQPPNTTHSSPSNDTNFTTTYNYEYYYGNDWRDVVANSRFSLAPRGYGRTSYHLMETLQMGRIPIHVYRDIPWVPYADTVFATAGFVAQYIGVDNNNNTIDAVLARLLHMTDADIQERERRIVALRATHFTVSGALAQIGRFLLSGGSSDSNADASDLRCQALPSSPRDL